MLLLVPANDSARDAANAEELNVLVDPEEKEELVDEEVGARIVVAELRNTRGDRRVASSSRHIRPNNALNRGERYVAREVGYKVSDGQAPGRVDAHCAVDKHEEHGKHLDDGGEGIELELKK